jgi:hypothetical protein
MNAQWQERTPQKNTSFSSSRRASHWRGKKAFSGGDLLLGMFDASREAKSKVSSCSQTTTTEKGKEQRQ